MIRRKQTIILRQLDSGEVMAYDLRRGTVLNDIVDYSVWQLRRCRRPSTVFQAATCIAALFSFLQTEAREIADLTVDLLIGFRDREVARIAGEGQGATAEERTRRAQVTVNQKLLTIFDWCRWLDETGRAPRHLAPIVEPVVAMGSTRRRGPVSGSQLLFRVKRDTHARMGRTPDDEQVEAAGADLFANADPYLGRRNYLIFNIARRVGLRRSSIACLRCEDFSRFDVLSSPESSWDVVPTHQKFGYLNGYEFPVDLVVDIKEFVDGERAELCSRLGIDDTRSAGLLFLSAKTGEPLHPHSVTPIIGKAMRKVGMSRGNATHALRRRFADEQLVEDLLFRLEVGLDTSIQSLAVSLARKLGHRSIESLSAYISIHHVRLLKDALRKRENTPS